MDWKVIHDQYHLKTNKEALVLDIAIYYGDNIDVHTAIPQRDANESFMCQREMLSWHLMDLYIEATMQLRAGNSCVDRIIPVLVVMEWYRRVAAMECHRFAQR